MKAAAGAWISAIMKEFVQPNKEEIDKYQQFVDGVLWGGLQYKDGPHQVRSEARVSSTTSPTRCHRDFYRSDFDWSTWTSWNKKASERVDRSYDYPHVAAAYWVLYHLARNHPGLVTNHPWDWYLDKCLRDFDGDDELRREYAIFGQMEGDIFLQILADLKREGWNTQADASKATCAGAPIAGKEAYPFGSEMPWDSTGQEEVYAWTKYFGYNDKADVTLNAILGYDPAIPHWGYNGSARRYWDFIFGASHKYRRLERQLHHYGSGLNAIPLLSEYRDHPDDFYLLRVGYAGNMGVLTDIDQEGFALARISFVSRHAAFRSCLRR